MCQPHKQSLADHRYLKQKSRVECVRYSVDGPTAHPILADRRDLEQQFSECIRHSVDVPTAHLIARRSQRTRAKNSECVRQGSYAKRRGPVSDSSFRVACRAIIVSDIQWPVSDYSIRVPTAHSVSSMLQRYPARFRVSPTLNRCAKDN